MFNLKSLAPSTFFIFAALTPCADSALANSIFLTPSTTSVKAGSDVLFDVMYNFTDIAIGGGFDVWFGNYTNPNNPTNTFTNGHGLSFVSYTPNSALLSATDPNAVFDGPIFSTNSALHSDHLENIYFSLLSGLPTNGPQKIGTLDFKTTADGTFFLTLLDNPTISSPSPTAFIDLSGAPLSYAYTGAAVTVTGVVPPIPAPLPVGALAIGVIGMSFCSILIARRQVVVG
jgi:hypothetical protein